MNDSKSSLKFRLSFFFLSIVLIVGFLLLYPRNGYLAKNDVASPSDKLNKSVPGLKFGNSNNAIFQANGCNGFGFSYARGFAPDPPTQERPISVVSGDFNQDGKADIVAVNLFSNSISVLTGDGAGGFSMPSNILVVGDQKGLPAGLGVGDFNGDGKLDLAIAILYNPGRVIIFNGDGAGNFSQAASLNAGINTTAITIGDFNGDGKPDIAAANKGDFAAMPPEAGNVTVYINDGLGNFSAGTNIAVGTSPVALVNGDFNGDNKIDLAVVNNISATVSILPGDGAGNFGTATTLTVGANPNGIVAGYFDGDAKLDLAVTQGGTVAVFIANGTGGFNTAATYNAGTEPYAIITADFNGDSKPDLAVTNHATNQTSVLLNNGSGVFNAPQTAAVGSQPLSLVSGDFNGDTKADLAVANSSSNNISILLGKGNGTFGRTTFLFSDPEAVTTEDFNGDGIPDIAVANFGGDKITIFLADKNGGYNVPSEYNSRIKPVDLTTGDFNKDGKLDIAVANNGSDSVSILLGDGAGGFSPQMEFAAGTRPRSIASGDFNKDGNLDLITANEGSSNLTLMLGQGDGTFGAPTTFFAGGQPVSIDLDDLNGDGNLDLVVANQTSEYISILLGNGAGNFTPAANVNLPSGRTANDVTIVDLNKDGKLDLAIAIDSSTLIAIAKGNGNGTFATPTTIDFGGTNPTSIEVEDFDGDTIADIAVNSSANNYISLLRGKGDGTFEPPRTYATGSGPEAIAVGDLNNDKRTDLVIVNLLSNSMTLLLNTCANTPPSITAGAPLTRTQGGTATTSSLVTISDLETAAKDLAIGLAAPAGITVTELTNNNGVITAKIGADCAAPTGDYNVTLTVTDPLGLSSSANIKISVAANTAPVLGTYPNGEAVAAGSTTIAPTAAPTDNGVINTLTVSASAGFTGTVSINSTSGIVNVTNAGPAGNYTITVNASDNCGAITAKTTKLTVVPPVLISSLNPSTKQAQSGDFNLSVNGSGFTANSKVRWNGSDRTTTYVSANQLTAAIPGSDINLNNAGSANITVFDPAAGGITSNTSAFAITSPNPIPTITSLNPSTVLAGAGAFTLSIVGTNFLNQSVVKFNGADRTTTYVSATELKINVTAAEIANPGTAAITVFTSAPGGGTSNTGNLAINNPAPGAITLSPTATLIGSAATTLTINGSGFRANSVVRVNGSDRTTTYISDSQLSITLAATELATAGTLAIAVNTPPPGGGLSPSATFTVNNPAPTLTTLNPASILAGGAAFTLAINGTGFLNSSVAKLNGSDRTTTFISSTQVTIAITAAEIANPGTLKIVVVNPSPGGGTSNELSVPINNPAPTLTALDKTSIQIGSAATAVTLTGSGFRPNSIVRVNGSDRTTTYISPTQLSTVLSAADLSVAGTIKFSVFTPTPGGGTTTELNFTVTNPMPALTTLNPATVLTGSAAFTLAINGSGFINNSTVKWNGADRTTTLVNANQLTIAVSAADVANAGTAKITVFNPAPVGGTSNELSLAINNPAPVATILSQSSITAGTGASTLTVTGTGFRPDSIGRVNGQDRATTYVSSTDLKVALLAADVAIAGTLKIAIFTPSPGGGLSSELMLTVNNPAPTLTGISPNSAFKGDPAFTLTLTGTNFVTGSIVRWNGADRATTYVSSTQLKASITAGDLSIDGNFSVTVFNPAPGGGTTSAITFAVKPLTGFEADVTPRPTGNNDGKVTIADWVQVGRFAAGLDTVQNSSEFQRADCAPLATNGDGKLGIADWVQAGRFAVGLDPVVPASGPSQPASLLAITQFRSESARFELAQPEAARTIRAINADFKRGELNALAIQLEGQGNENGLSFSLNYDPKLLNFSHVIAPNGWTVNVNATQAAVGRLGLMLSYTSGQTISFGKNTIVNVYFAPVGGVDSVMTKIGFDDLIVSQEVVDARASILPLATYEPATINISGHSIAMVRAASYVGPDLAGDSIASAFGADLATTTAAANALPLPTQLGGTTVKIIDSQGIERSAPLFFVSPGQINYLIPNETANGFAKVTITNGLGKSSSGLIQVSSISPNLFAADSTGQGLAAAQVVRVGADNSQTWEPVARYDSVTGKFVSVPIDLGSDRGNQSDKVYLVLFGTGIRHRSDLNNLRLKIGKVVVPVEYAGPQGDYIGVDQINARIPRILIGHGDVDIELIVDGLPANVVKTNIR